MRDYTDEQKEKFIAQMKRFMGANFVNDDHGVFHFKARDTSMGHIEVAKNVSGIDFELPVIVEYATREKGIKFIYHGHYFPPIMLERRYGGIISNHLYWIMYAERGGDYGIKNQEIKSIDDIKVSEMQEQIAEWLT